MEEDSTLPDPESTQLDPQDNAFEHNNLQPPQGLDTARYQRYN